MSLRGELAGWIAAARGAVRWHLETGERALPIRDGYRPPPLGHIAPLEPERPAPTPPVAQPPDEPPTAARVARSAGEKATALAALRDDQLGDCQRCKLAEGRRNIVFGVGHPDARLVFVGEAPGFHEDQQGEPFVGRAGELLSRMIDAMGLTRDDVYICNVIKCRPPKNRDPDPDEIEACEPFLKAQLAVIEPEAIVTLGAFASRCLLRSTASISRLRGRWHSYQGVPVMVTFHPAYLLRNAAMKRPVWEDLKKVMQRLAPEPRR